MIAAESGQGQVQSQPKGPTVIKLVGIRDYPADVLIGETPIMVALKYTAEYVARGGILHPGTARDKYAATNSAGLQWPNHASRNDIEYLVRFQFAVQAIAHNATRLKSDITEHGVPVDIKPAIKVHHGCGVHIAPISTAWTRHAAGSTAQLQGIVSE